MFVLRCYRVAVAPLVVYCVLLWGVGLAGGYALAYEDLGPWPAQQSPAAFWAAGGAGARRCCGLILPAILWRAVRVVPAADGGAARLAGNRIAKVDPTPGVLSIFNSPPCRCTTCLTMARPRPVPPVSRERLRSTR